MPPPPAFAFAPSIPLYSRHRTTVLHPSTVRPLPGRRRHRLSPPLPTTASAATPADDPSSPSDAARIPHDPGEQVDDGSLSSTSSYVTRPAPPSQSTSSTMFIAPKRIRRKAPPTPAPAPAPARPTAPLAFLVGRLTSHKALLDTLALGAMFITWYWANTVFNVYNKQVLRVFPFPVTCTMLQFAVAAVCMTSLWLFRARSPPRVNALLLRATLPLAVLHAAGFLLTNMSLGKVSVAFTHTVKSTEPFFSVALTPGILGEVPTWGIIMSLFPIVAGVALASATEVSFNWVGFLAAVGSNLALQSRNVLSKKLMTTSGANQSQRKGGNKRRQQPHRRDHMFGLGARAGESYEDVEDDTFARLDNINLFSTMTVLAFLILLPVSFLWEGNPLLTAAAAPAVTGMSSALLAQKLVLGGICRCIDVLASYMILQRVSPVTHSVGNCVKRAVVIAMSIVIFKTKMSILNVVGTLLALTGVFIYSMIVSACKQDSFGPDSSLCKPIYEKEVELLEGGGI